MEPISIILTALVAGAAKAATDMAPDAYKGLKAQIVKKFACNAEIIFALLRYFEPLFKLIVCRLARNPLNRNFV